MPEVLISLIGEQPAPNLLPLRFYHPSKMLLVYTSHSGVRQVAERLKLFFKGSIEPYEVEVEAFRMDNIQEVLLQFIRKQQWDKESLLFNITGGTKPMSIAAFQLAEMLGAPAVYFQSQGNRSLLYLYEVSSDRPMHEAGQKIIPETITLDDYIRLYVGEYQTGQPRDEFEESIYHFLKSTEKLSEILTSVRPLSTPNLEVDLFFRLGNQVGIAEVKKTAKKRAIDQLNSAAGQRHFGTYIKKFIISEKPMEPDTRILAAEYRIDVIELQTDDSSEISPANKERLIETIRTKLGGRP